MKNLKELLNINQDELIVFTSKTCKYCTSLKELLKKEKIKFTEKDIVKYNKEWNNLVDLSNVPMTPAICYNGKNFFPGRDFPNPEMLIKILKTYERTNTNFDEKTYERLTTLNYNIHKAFTSLDKRLQDIEKLLKSKENEHKSTN